jgi:hypothetical protein
LRALIVPCAQEVNEIVMSGIPAEDLTVTRRTLLAVIENLAGDTLASPDDDSAGSEQVRERG